jgi:Carbohydrate binding module (family 35)
MDRDRRCLRGPAELFEGSYPVRHGRISVPVNDIEHTDAYVAVITPDRHGHGARPARRHEAEDVVGGQESNPLASGNASALLHKRRDATFTVDAPKAGAYDLVIRYSSPEAVTGTVEVNGRARRFVEYARTGRAVPFATQRTHVVLKRGRNRIDLAVRAGSLGLDYIEVTPFRTRGGAGADQVHASTLTLAKGDPSYPGGTQPGTVDLDYVDVELAP